jgi:hypothetical protein
VETSKRRAVSPLARLVDVSPPDVSIIYIDGVEGDVGVQCNKVSKLRRETVPDVFPAGSQLLGLGENRRWGWGEESEPGDGQAAKG